MHKKDIKFVHVQDSEIGRRVGYTKIKRVQRGKNIYVRIFVFLITRWPRE